MKTLTDGLPELPWFADARSGTPSPFRSAATAFCAPVPALRVLGGAKDCARALPAVMTTSRTPDTVAKNKGSAEETAESLRRSEAVRGINQIPPDRNSKLLVCRK